MTSEEQELAKLLDTYDKVKTTYDKIHSNLPELPTYNSRSGRNTPAEIVDYKNRLAEYEKHAALLAEADVEVKKASAALDAWIPTPTKESLGRGAGIFTNLIGGPAVLFYTNDQYVILRGRSSTDLERVIAHYKMYGVIPD